jgi:hypothetical protein
MQRCAAIVKGDRLDFGAAQIDSDAHDLTSRCRVRSARVYRAQRGKSSDRNGGSELVRGAGPGLGARAVKTSVFAVTNRSEDV